MARVHLFAGPTLAGVSLPPGVTAHPPAAAGDLLALEGLPPATVLLVDGAFGRVRSVWHREVLTLLAAGWWVIGAGSMGALRAAELAPWGMEGVGLVHRAFRAGVLADDGELAVAHAPAALGWRPLGPALVDVRWTACTARRAGLLTRRQEQSLVRRAAATPFARRTWGPLLEALPEAHPMRRAWPAAERSLKREDALKALAAALASGPGPMRPACSAPPQTGWRERLQPSPGPHAGGGRATGRDRSNSTRR